MNMYVSIESKATKTHYKEILEETREIAMSHLEKLRDEPLDSPAHIVWTSILNQINDIQDNIVDNSIITEWQDIYKRYTVGLIGLQAFDDNDEMQLRLNDIFYGAVHYNEFPD